MNNNNNNNNKISLDDIFADDLFKELDSKEKATVVKTEDDRRVDSFEEINAFIDKNNREPSTSSMSEYGLYARLKNIKEDEELKSILKPYDKHNILGEVEVAYNTINDILDDDEFGLLDIDSDLSIFKYKHISEEDERAKADFVAQRQSMSEKEFKPYEAMFQKVHKELKEGKRKLLPFRNAEDNLLVGNFYLIGGLMLYLKEADLKKTVWEQKSGNRERLEGRTFTIFENGTYSNMLFRSLGKQILKDGKMITNTDEDINRQLFVNSGAITDEDELTGWIYILKSQHPEVSVINDAYKIGVSTVPVEERIQNAKNEATYLCSDVHIVETMAIYNRNANKLEQLLHRFFGAACLDIDVFKYKGQRATPREWFVVPKEVIIEAINLILKDEIIDYKYDSESKRIVRK